MNKQDLQYTVIKIINTALDIVIQTLNILKNSIRTVKIIYLLMCSIAELPLQRQFKIMPR